jgi:hypothetical protein
MKKPIKRKDDRHLGYFVVAYIDLLGQQDKIRSLKVPTGLGDTVAIEEARKVINDTYGAVKMMRKSFITSFEAFAQSPIQKKLPVDLNNNPIQIQSFSDSIIIYLSMRTDKFKLPVRGIYAILCASAVTFLHCLAHGHPIRGGIDIGAAFEPVKGEIYGPALSRAYTLESKCANHPRIIIGNELQQYLIASSKQEETDIYSQASKRTADMCIKLLAQDDDGYAFVDYLGQTFHSLTKNQIPASITEKAYDNILKASNYYKETKYSKLAFRYTLLRDYFYDRLSHNPAFSFQESE